MTAFKPLGEKSRRVMVMEEISTRDEGDIITYDELGEVLGGVDRSDVQAAVNDAKVGLEKKYSKAVVAIRNEGYRVVHAKEHLGLAQHHQRKSFRQLVKSRSKVVNVDYKKLSEGERAAMTLAATAINLTIEAARRHDIRASRLEKAVETVKTTQERSDAEIIELKARLARLENESRRTSD